MSADTWALLGAQVAGNVVLAAVVTGVLAAVTAGIGVYYQQRNRHRDKVDANTLSSTSLRVQDTRDALDAWQKIVATLGLQITQQQSQITQQQNEITDLRKLNEECERRTNALQAELTQLQRQLGRGPGV